MKKSDYLDHIVLDTLNKLSTVVDGLRYTELKTQLRVSDASLVNRLNKLKNAGYIDIKLMSTKTGRHYTSYILTPSGTELVKILNISELLKNVESQILLN